MRQSIKLSAAAMIGGALLLSGCASTGVAPTTPNPQSNNGYQLPQGVYDGYWAMTKKMSGQAVVISFKNGKAHNYRFTCQANGNYVQAGMETYNLISHPNAIGLQYSNEPEFSTIKVLKLESIQSLVLNQTFNQADLQQAYPNGKNYSYVYKSRLEPICR